MKKFNGKYSVNDLGHCCFCGFELNGVKSIYSKHHVYGIKNSERILMCHKDCHNRFHLMEDKFHTDPELEVELMGFEDGC